LERLRDLRRLFGQAPEVPKCRIFILHGAQWLDQPQMSLLKDLTAHGYSIWSSFVFNNEEYTKNNMAIREKPLFRFASF